MNVILSIFVILSIIHVVNSFYFHHKKLSINKLYSNPVYLERMVERKKAEVDSLLRKHQAADDPLFMRMSYLASENRFNITNSIRQYSKHESEGNKMSIVIDIKRRSPTIHEKRNIVDYSSAAKFSELLTKAGADAFLINTDDIEYGGKFEDLYETSTAVKSASLRLIPPAVIQKDLIIHPVQIAQALQQGASGILLIAAVVGGDLETLLDACTIMGTEAIVEVHTPNELDFALSKGATIFLVNMWDRLTGKHFPEQAKGLATMMPMNAVALAAGDIGSVEQVAELSYYGYDGIVLGRRIAEMEDIKGFIDAIHAIQGPATLPGMPPGLKGSLLANQ